MAAAQNWWSLPMPANYEAKYDPGQKRYFYINHNDKSTTWEDPRLKVWQQMQQQQQYQQPRPAHQAPSGTVNVSFANMGSAAAEHRTDRSPQPSAHRQENIPMTSADTWQQQDTARDVDADAVKRIKKLYPTAEEWAVRKALAKCGNSEGMACNELTRSGYKRQNASQQHQETVIVTKLKAEFPSAEEGVIRDVVQCVDRDESQARTQLKHLGYSPSSRASSPAPRQPSPAPRQPSPAPRQPSPAPRQPSPAPRPSEAEKRRLLENLKQEFPEVAKEMVEVAATVANFDETRAKVLLKMEMDKKNKKTPSRSKSPSPAASSSTTTPASASTDTAPSTSSQPVVFEPSNIVFDFTPSSSTSTEPQGRGKKATPAARKQSPKKKVTTAMARAQPTRSLTQGGAYVSANRSEPMGSDPTVVQGPDKNLLIQEYTVTSGPDPNNRHGPDCSTLHGPGSAMGHDPELYYGPDPELYHGPDPDIRDGPGVCQQGGTLITVV